MTRAEFIESAALFLFMVVCILAGLLIGPVALPAKFSDRVEVEP